MQPDRYTRLINCDSPDEVLSRVRAWSSDLDEREHLIRSTIFEIHAHLEEGLKQILYAVFLPLVFHGDDEGEYEVRKRDLDKMIQGLNFATLHRLLEPSFTAFPADELSDIKAINQVRNQAAHGAVDQVYYKGRSPFRDADCLAQFYLDMWAANQVLTKFLDTMIEYPRALAERYRNFYNEKIEQSSTGETLTDQSQ